MRTKPRLLVVFAAVVALATAGCAPSLVLDGRDLNGSQWRAILVAGQPPAVDAAPTLIFESGTVHGFAGCNTYGSQGPASIVNGRLKLGDLLQTVGGCVETGGVLSGSKTRMSFSFKFPPDF